MCVVTWGHVVLVVLRCVLQRESVTFDKHLASVSAQYGHGFARSLDMERKAIRGFALPPQLNGTPCFANTFAGDDETMGFSDVLNVTRDSPDVSNDHIDRDAVLKSLA